MTEWLQALGVALLTLLCQAAHAQRSSEDAVAEALDAFGSGVGRETIGLYSSGNARGFSPVQAARIEPRCAPRSVSLPQSISASSAEA